jgi:hypothetical protein
MLTSRLGDGLDRHVAHQEAAWLGSIAEGRPVLQLQALHDLLPRVLEVRILNWVL